MNHQIMTTKTSRAERTLSAPALLVLLLALMVGGISFYLVLAKAPLPLVNPRAASLFAALWGLFCIIVLVAVLRMPFVSFPIWFLVGTWMYAFSVFVLQFFDGDTVFYYSFLLVSMKHVRQGLPVVTLAFSAFLIGAIIGRVQRRSAAAPPPQDVRLALLVQQVATTVYIISLLVVLFYSVRGSGLTIAYNYAYSGNLEGFSDLRKLGLLPTPFLVALYWFLPWSTLIVLSSAQTPRQTRISLMAAALTGALALLVGDRDIPLTLIALGLSLYWLKKRGAIRYNYLALALLVLVLLLRVVPDIRTVPIRDWSLPLVVDIVTGQFANNETYVTPFGGVFAALSSSYQTLMGTLMLVPESEPFRLGADYVASFQTAVPFLSRFLPEWAASKPTTWITQSLRPGGWTGLGYLQVAEAYLQFGAFGVLGLYALMGWGLVRIWRKLEAGASVQFFAFSFILMQSMLTWIRNDSGVAARSLFWAWILVYLLPHVLSRVSPRSTGPTHAPATLRMRSRQERGTHSTAID